MTDEILKLAKECGGWEVDAKIAFYPSKLEAFYRAAFNAGLEAGAKERDELVVALLRYARIALAKVGADRGEGS